MENQEMNEVVVRHSEQIKTLFERMGNLEKLTESVNKLAISLERLTGKQTATEAQVAHLAEDVEGIKEKPGKRWESVVVAVIGALVGAAVTYFIK